jgi:hypothetical protein
MYLSPDMKRYFMNILIAFDQLANVILGGDPDETISSRLGKAHDSIGTWARGVVDRIFGKGHCARSVEPDEGGKGLF